MARKPRLEFAGAIYHVLSAAYGVGPINYKSPHGLACMLVLAHSIAPAKSDSAS
jgi:hypothetical protein